MRILLLKDESNCPIKKRVRLTNEHMGNYKGKLYYIDASDVR